MMVVRTFLIAILFLSSIGTNALARSSLPPSINTGGEKVVLVDPRAHAWGAYDENGNLVRSGLASAGSNWCSDLGRPCRTESGIFRIFSLGSASCYSARFPIPHGGAPMPYCMYFNGNQALHGSPHVVYGNISHGCVRLRTPDAKWLRFNFVEGPNEMNGYRGTLVVVRPY